MGVDPEVEGRLWLRRIWRERALALGRIIENLIQCFSIKIHGFYTSATKMNLISQYTPSPSQPQSPLASPLHPYSQQSILKLCRSFTATLLAPTLGPRSKVPKPCPMVSFGILHQSRNIHYDYLFTIQLNLQTNVWKIVATILRDGRLMDVYKEGLVQMLATYCLNVNGLMSYYSLRVHPFTGVAKFVYVNHCTDKQMADFFRFPVNFCEMVTRHVQEMVNRLDERFLGKILHLTNQITLSQILPSNADVMDQTPQQLNKLHSLNSLFPAGTLSSLYNQSRAIKQIKKHLINSTIRYSFLYKDSEGQRIRFLPDHRRKQAEKEHKIVRHNIKVMPFCYDVKRMLARYAPMDVIEEPGFKTGDISWIQPTEDEVKEILDIIKIDNFVVGGRILTPILIHSIENQVAIGIGGFAQISRLNANIAIRQDHDNPEQRSLSHPAKKLTRQCLVRKYASKQKLFWEKSVIQHIGKGSCIFINKYYEPKLDSEAIGIEKGYLEDSIFMEYCQEKSLNNYLNKMGSIISMKVKIFILYQVSVGLRYLRDYGIVHLDMKPENLLVKMASSVTSSAFALIKIIDYGQAYCETLLSKKMNRGHTCPYASPELVRHSQTKYTQKSDVFSLGVMILIIVFQLNTVDIKRLTSSTLFQSNDRYIRFYSLCMEKCRYLGYEPQMQCLLNLAYKCINPITSSRPYLNWICVILRSLLNMFEGLEI